MTGCLGGGQSFYDGKAIIVILSVSEESFCLLSLYAFTFRE